MVQVREFTLKGGVNNVKERSNANSAAEVPKAKDVTLATSTAHQQSIVANVNVLPKVCILHCYAVCAASSGCSILISQIPTKTNR